MRIIISNSSSIPIYEQIKKTIIAQIISGELEENELLPSIRSLAKDIRISVMTIKKAYDELEQEGYILTVHGKGSFVAPKNLELIKEQKLKEMESYIEKIMEIAKQYQIKKEEIEELLDLFYRSEEE